VTGPSEHPSWERLVFWLVAGVIGLQLAASVLPRLVVPVVVLAGVFVVVRLVLFHTRKW
jgi:hypothetical protein